MARANRTNSPARRIALGDDLRIGAARATFAALMAAADSPVVEIDAKKVERIDGAGLQALVAALTRLRAGGVDCRWTDVPPALSQAAALAGLGATLALG